MRSSKGKARSCLTLKRFRSKAFFSVPAESVWAAFCNVKVYYYQFLAALSSEKLRRELSRGYEDGSGAGLPIVNPLQQLASCIFWGLVDGVPDEMGLSAFPNQEEAGHSP